MFRDLLLKALEPFPNVRDYLIHMRFKPKPKYDRGLFLDLDAPLFDASLVGQMIPQPEVFDGPDRARLDAHLGDGFSLIGQGQAASDALAALGRDTFCGLPLAALTLQTIGSEVSGALRGADDVTARPFLTHRDQILLVRPDRYCAAAFFPDALDTGLRRYEGLLRGTTDMRPAKVLTA
jgi:3-(3-hydroxy-phenyl)propionate hydroxylase